MGYLLKAILLLLVLSLQVMGDAVTPLGVMGLILLIASWIFREKYHNHLLLMAGEAVLLFFLAFGDSGVMILYAVLAFDLAARGLLWPVLLLLPSGVYHLRGEDMGLYAALLALCAFSGNLQHTLMLKEDSFREVYDQERRSRYTLEDTKAKLMASAQEAAHLAEITERNRIAREIHDSLGHNLAGILLQLQAAVKTLDRDEGKARELLRKSVSGLADSLNLLRDTVHNIRPREQLGLEYFRQVIDNFQFCPVEFQHSGNLAALSPSYTEIIASIVKESLTNASRHSQASKMEIRLEVRENIVRLYIKDNGVGCTRLKEGMGLSGMRERVHSAGGTIAFNSGDGFMIVSVLPREDKTGGELLAGTRS